MQMHYADDIDDARVCHGGIHLRTGQHAGAQCWLLASHVIANSLQPRGY
jgi:hypothetical protein